MCGIGGVLFSPAGDLLGVAGRMVERLRHRGPDASGVALLPGGEGVFAHTRLKIIDLSERAAQPFVSDDGRVLLTFNGEIYNFRELRAALQRDGATFRSGSDTEVILRQYLQRGLDGLPALDGMFAFALWDGARRRLVLMRDRAGKKPLYWARAPDGAFVFGSEIKALFEYAPLPVEVARGRIPEYLTYGYVSTPGSLFAGVNKLPAASRLLLDAGAGAAPEITRYWSLPDDRPIEAPLGEVKAMVRAAIGRAVEKRLVSDVPLGAFLSGGIDSSIVVAEMARRSSTRVKTFCVGFVDDATYDERKYARDVAARFDCEHTEIELAALPTDQLGGLLHFHDEPYGDASALAVHAVSKATRPHVTVVLTGDGGDEVFAGYTRFRGGMLTGAVPRSASRLARALLTRVPEPRGYKNRVAIVRRFVEHGERSGDEQLLAWNAYFAGPELARLLNPTAYGRNFDPWSVLREQIAILELARQQGHDRLDQILRHNYATYLLDDLLVKADRMTMSVALEARAPFLDTALVELAFRLPSRMKLRHGRLKGLLREAYRDILPPSVLDRQKHGFGVPIGRWWSGALAPMVDDLLIAPGARVFEYLDAARLAEVVREHRTGRRNHDLRIFALLQLELWLRGLAR